MRKSLLFVALLGLLFFSCKKDETLNENEALDCPGYTQTTDSFDQLIADASMSELLFEKSISSTGPHFNVQIDVDCDGQGDFEMTSYTDSDYIGNYAINESEIFFKCLNTKLKILTHSVTDTLYHLNTHDTIGTTIYSSTTNTTTYQPGATFQGTATDVYVKGVNPGDTILANDAGWNSGTHSLRSHYDYNSSWYFGPDTNGYYIDAQESNDYNHGDIASGQYMAIKYEGVNGTKLGYIDFSFSVVGSWATFDFNFIRMHR